jgi:superfamily II DNA helicase RecQ
MQIKIFSIRLGDNLTEIDQNSLNDFLGTIVFKKSSVQFVDVENPFWSVVIHFEEKELITNEVIPQNQKSDVVLNAKEEDLFNNLKNWRNEKAVELSFAPFMICHNSELKNIAILKPNSIDDLKQIKGFGDLKATKYGDDIIALLNAV